MPLPTPKRCCGCLSVETKFFVVSSISILLCIANITAGAWKLPRHKQREPEDNLISMSMVMFSTLSAIGDLVACAGAWLRRPGYMQLAQVFNSVFVVCLFLIAAVTCLFSPELQRSGFLAPPENIALVVIVFFAGFAAVTCLFSPELQRSGFHAPPVNIALVVIVFFAGFAYAIYHFIAVHNMYKYIRSDGGSPIPI